MCEFPRAGGPAARGSSVEATTITEAPNPGGWGICSVAMSERPRSGKGRGEAGQQNGFAACSHRAHGERLEPVLQLLLATRAGDLYGRRRVFLFGLVVFTLTSLVGDFAENTHLRA